MVISVYPKEQILPEHGHTVKARFLVFETKDYIKYNSDFNTNPSRYTGEPNDMLELGEITGVHEFKSLISCDINYSYEEISGSATIKLPYLKQYLPYLIKGRRCVIQARRGSDWHTLLLGFIIDIKYNDKEIELNLRDYSIVLERKNKVTFNNLKASQILKELTKESGMVPRVYFNGLTDRFVKRYSTKSLSAKKKTIKGKVVDSDCTETNKMRASGAGRFGHAGTGLNWGNKAKKLYHDSKADYAEWANQFNDVESMLKSLRSIWHYKFYYSNRTCPKRLFNPKGFGSNCYDACRLVKVLCDSAGFPCVIITGDIWRGGHGWNCIKVNNEWKTFDLCYKTRIGVKGGTNEAGF